MEDSVGPMGPPEAARIEVEPRRRCGDAVVALGAALHRSSATWDANCAVTARRFDHGNTCGVDQASVGRA